MLQSIVQTCRRVIREPLATFALLSLLLFVLHHKVSDPTGAGRGEVHVTSSHIHQLVRGFEQTWSRSPGPEEIDELIQGYIRDEIMFRAAVAMGLDQEDSEVRRHLLTKLDRFSSDMVNAIPVDDATLETFLQENLDKYKTPERFSFEQLYFNSNAEDKARAVLTRLQDEQDSLAEAAPIDRARLADPNMLSQYCETCSLSQVVWGYGHDLAEQLPELSIGQWQGPIATDMGLHLVKIQHYEPAAKPEFKTLRAELERDFRFEHRSRMMDDLTRHRTQQFRIQVDEYTWTQELSDNSEPASQVSMNVEN